MEEGKVWNLVLEKIKNDVTDVTFKNYFKQTVLHSLTYVIQVIFKKNLSKSIILTL